MSLLSQTNEGESHRVSDCSLLTLSWSIHSGIRHSPAVTSFLTPVTSPNFIHVDGIFTTWYQVSPKLMFFFYSKPALLLCASVCLAPLVRLSSSCPFAHVSRCAHLAMLGLCIFPTPLTATTATCSRARAALSSRHDGCASRQLFRS